VKIKDAINPVLNEKNLFPVKKIATAANALNRTERNRAETIPVPNKLIQK
jgi:hypothetical protein